MKYITIAFILITISALLVWLPNTNTLLDSWRIYISIATGILAFISAFIFLMDLHE